MTRPTEDPGACALPGCPDEPQATCLQCRRRHCRQHADHARHSGAGTHPSRR